MTHILVPRALVDYLTLYMEYNTEGADAEAAARQLRYLLDAPEQEPVLEVVAEPDHWHNGHFYEDTGRSYISESAISKLPIGTKLYTTPPAAVPKCQHRIADARNPLVKSGYICIDCGSLFSAADHEDERVEPDCNPHPKAPHGFNRNSSHSAGRYVCDCEGWNAWESGYSEGMEAGSKIGEYMDASNELQDAMDSPPAAAVSEPLTQQQVVDAFCTLPHNVQYVSVFDAGVRFAEKHHGIGEKQ